MSEATITVRRAYDDAGRASSQLFKSDALALTLTSASWRALGRPNVLVLRIEPQELEPDDEGVRARHWRPRPEHVAAVFEALTAQGQTVAALAAAANVSDATCRRALQVLVHREQAVRSESPTRAALYRRPTPRRATTPPDADVGLDFAALAEEGGDRELEPWGARS